MTKATLTIASKNYGSWSLRGWLLCKMANLDFAEAHVSTDDPSTRAELLLLIAVFSGALPHPQRAQGLGHAGDRRIPPRDHARGGPVAARHRRARPLPFDLRRNAFRLQQSALGAADEPQNALSRLQGLGRRARRHRARHRRSGRSASSSTADLICSAPNRAPPTPCTRRCAPVFRPTTSRSTRSSAKYCETIMALPIMQEWIAAAKLEPDELEELDVEF